MYGPDVAILLMYGSHDMRHTGFPQVDGGQRDPREMERHNSSTHKTSRLYLTGPLKMNHLNGRDIKALFFFFFWVGNNILFQN